MPSSTRPLLLILALCLIITSCATQTATVQPGSPAFFWGAAKRAFASGDYLKASENLTKLTGSDNEYRTRANAWLAVLSAGMTKGYLEIAEAYDTGAHSNHDNPLIFRRQAGNMRTMAKASVLQFAESMHYFNDKGKDPSVEFEFGAPSGRLADIPNLLKVGTGIMPPPADAESTQITAVQKGVVWSTAHAVGAGDDASKAADLFKTLPVQVPREKFMLGMAAALAEEAEVFGPKQLDEPQRLKMVCMEAIDALKQVPDSKEAKDTRAKLDKLLKTIKPS